MSRHMPSREYSKSFDHIDTKIAKYQSLACNIIDKIRHILQFGYSSQLLYDYEFTITSLTLLNLKIIPRELKYLNYIHQRYSCIHL